MLSTALIFALLCPLSGASRAADLSPPFVRLGQLTVGLCPNQPEEVDSSEINLDFPAGITVSQDLGDLTFRSFNEFLDQALMSPFMRMLLLREAQSCAARLHLQGRYGACLRQASQLRAAAVDGTGTGDLSLAGVLSVEAECRMGLGQVDAAVDLHRRALALRRKNGDTGEELDRVKMNLGEALSVRGERGEAQALLEQAWASRWPREPFDGKWLDRLSDDLVHLTSRPPYTTHHRAVAGARQAEASLASGDGPAALVAAEEALKSWTELLGEDDPRLALPLALVATSHTMLGEPEEARALRERAQRAAELGWFHADETTVRGLLRLVESEWAVAEVSAARRHMEQVLYLVKGIATIDPRSKIELLSGLSVLEQSMGAWRLALSHLQQADASLVRLGQTDASQRATLLWQLAGLCHWLGEDSQERVALTTLAALEPDKGVQVALGLARLEWEAGTPEEARRYAASAQERADPSTPPDVIADLASLLERMDDHEAAEALLAGHPMDSVLPSIVRVESALDREDPTSALDLLQSSELDDLSLPLSWWLRFQAAKATSALELGDVGRAGELLDRAVAGLPKQALGQGPLLVAAVGPLSGPMLRLGRFEDLESMLNLLYPQGGDTDGAQVALVRARLDAARGRRVDATSELHSALAALGTTPRPAAIYLSLELARLDLESGDLPMALAAANEALKAIEAIYGKGSWRLAEPLGILASIDLEAGRPKSALSLAQAGLDLPPRVPASWRGNLALTAARSQIELGEPRLAASVLELALEDPGPLSPGLASILSATRVLAGVAAGEVVDPSQLEEATLEVSKHLADGHPLRIAISQLEMGLMASGGRTSEAMAACEGAEAAALAQLDQLRGSASENDLARLVVRYRPILDQCLALDRPPVAQLASVWRWKAAAVANHDKCPDEVIGDGCRTLLDLYEERGSLFYRQMVGASPPGSDARLSFINGAIEELERRFSGAGGPASTPDLTAVQAALPPGALLLEYVRFRAYDGVMPALPAYAVFVVDRDAIHLVRLEDAEMVDDLAHRYWLAVSNPATSVGQIRRLGRSLYAAILGPALKASGYDALPEHLVVSPDGALAAVPFSALPSPTAPSEPILLHTRVTYALSGAALTQRQGLRRAPGDGVVVVGDPEPPWIRAMAARTTCPEYGLLASSGRLPGAAEEARQVADLYLNAGWSNVSLLVDRDADEASVTEALRHARVAHLATHAFLLPPRCADQPELPPSGRGPLLRMVTAPSAWWGASGERPVSEEQDATLRAGLVLSGEGPEQGTFRTDGLLTGMDIKNLDLSGAQLVVLSACGTGLGEMQPGRGVVGLRSAFEQAGADAVVVTLWSVDDRLTRRLMVQLHQSLLGSASGDPSLALWEVQRRAARSAGSRRAHPSSWAAFTYSGPIAPAEAP